MTYVQHTADDIAKMLQTIGVESVEDLFSSIPSEFLLNRPLEIPGRSTEAAILREFEALAGRNRRLDTMPSFLGAGVYNRFIPAAVDHLSSRGEFMTAYTPYQPEVSQGTLQAIFEYQSLTARLTGMEISNASMYEAGTALAEAVLMAYAIHGKGEKVLISDALHPEYRRVLETYFRHHPISTESLPVGKDGRTAGEGLLPRQHGVFAMVLQNPNFFGIIEDGTETAATLDRWEGPPPLLIASVDPVSLGVLSPPGSYGVDIAVGDGQALGNEPFLGGPTFGFFATRMEHVRKIPGRVVGETRDRDGKRGYVLTFQTREQHIRRERATSNICTNQGLCCLRGLMALAFLGERGVRRVAELSTRMAHHAARTLCDLPGVGLAFGGPFFQEFVLDLPLPAADLYRRLLDRGVRGGLPLGKYFPDRSRQMMFATTEMTTIADIESLHRAMREILVDTAGGRGGPAVKGDRPGGATP